MRIKYKLREIKSELKFAWQRAWKGYDDSFWWGMDNTFVELYNELLKEFKNNLHSYPPSLTEDEWESILDEMIELLSNMEWSIEMDYHKAKINKDKFFKLFSEHFYDLWD